MTAEASDPLGGGRRPYRRRAPTPHSPSSSWSPPPGHGAVDRPEDQPDDHGDDGQVGQHLDGHHHPGGSYAGVMSPNPTVEKTVTAKYSAEGLSKRMGMPVNAVGSAWDMVR